MEKIEWTERMGLIETVVAGAGAWYIASRLFESPESILDFVRLYAVFGAVSCLALLTLGSPTDLTTFNILWSAIGGAIFGGILGVPVFYYDKWKKDKNDTYPKAI